MEDMTTGEQIDSIAKSARALGWKERPRAMFVFDEDGVKGVMWVRYNGLGDGEVHVAGSGYRWDYQGPSPAAPIIAGQADVPFELTAMLCRWIGIKVSDRGAVRD